MNVWYPTGEVGQYGCHRHPGVQPFTPARGNTCAECTTDPPPPDEVESKSIVPVAPAGTPGVVDHELAHLDRMQRLERSIAKLLTFGDQRLAECNRLIKDAGKLKLDGLKGQKKKDTQREKNEAQRNADAELARAVSSYNTAAKLEAEATKKRRAATELTRWREDWANTEKLEEELRKLREMHH